MIYNQIINNIYILEQKIKLPNDIINYINLFIGNPMIESKKYRYELICNGIVNNINYFERKRTSKLHKLKLGRGSRVMFGIINRHLHDEQNTKIIGCRNDIYSNKSIEKILFHFSKNKWRGSKKIPQHKYYGELIKRLKTI